MDDNFKISSDGIRAANLQLIKETLVHTKLVEEMLISIYCRLENKDINDVTDSLEKSYKKHLEFIDNYIKAEYGHLDISNILTSEKENTFRKD